MRVRLASTVLCLVLLAGCASMLPHSSSDSRSTFGSYAEALAAAGNIVPFKTSASQLAAMGFDPEQGKNVTVVPYPDIVARLVPYSGVGMDQLDPGVRACIVAQAACRGYVFRFERQDRNREGNFLSDFFNVRRVTHVTGWWFEALVVVSGDNVLFRNTAGEAHLERIEKHTNPLGPFQPAGEGAGSLLFN